MNRVIRVPADAQRVGFEWVVLGEPGFTRQMSEIGGQCPGVKIDGGNSGRDDFARKMPFAFKAESAQTGQWGAHCGAMSQIWVKKRGPKTVRQCVLGYEREQHSEHSLRAQVLFVCAARAESKFSAGFKHQS